MRHYSPVHGRIVVRGTTPTIEPWPAMQLLGLRFRQHGDDIVVEPTESTDSDSFIAAAKAALSPLACEIAYHGLAAQQLHLAEVTLADGSVHRPGAADIRLTDNRSFTGFLGEAAYDLTEARDYLIRSILAAISQRGADELAADATLLRAVESFLRALVSPSAVLQQLSPAIEHIEKRLGGRAELRRIGITKEYAGYVMMRANALPDPRSRHAPLPAAQPVLIPDVEVQECLRRAKHIVTSYAASATERDQ